MANFHGGDVPEKWKLILCGSRPLSLDVFEEAGGRHKFNLFCDLARKFGQCCDLLSWWRLHKYIHTYIHTPYSSFPFVTYNLRMTLDIYNCHASVSDHKAPDNTSRILLYRRGLFPI
jgi:hypothetical protein